MPCRHHDGSEVGADPRHSEATLSGFKRFDLSTSMLAGSAQHSLPNYELWHETSDSESVPKSGQVQLRGACACSLCLLNHRVHKLSESICNAAPYGACIMIVTAHWHAVTVAVSGTHVRYDRTLWHPWAVIMETTVLGHGGGVCHWHGTVDPSKP
jgi:hypothetical protein